MESAVDTPPSSAHDVSAERIADAPSMRCENVPTAGLRPIPERAAASSSILRRYVGTKRSTIVNTSVTDGAIRPNR